MRWIKLYIAKYKNIMMKILGDGAYGTKENYNVCDKLCISDLLKVRINSTLSGGSHERSTAVQDQLGEHVRSRHMKNIKQEIGMKILVYNLLVCDAY